MTRHYLLEELCYRDIHRDGKPYYQHEAGDSCDPDLQYLLSWDSFPGEGSEILELGCGDGFVTAVLTARGLVVTGIDCSATAIYHGQRNLALAGFKANLHVGDACHLESIPSESYPYVLDCHCLHCITDYRDRASFFRECCRVMSPEGRLFLATMGKQSMEWTRTIAWSQWQKARQSIYSLDERGCYVESLIPPGVSQRVNLRIFICEEILREEIGSAGLAVVRFECFVPQSDAGDVTFLLEVKRKE